MLSLTLQIFLLMVRNVKSRGRNRQKSKKRVILEKRKRTREKILLLQMKASEFCLYHHLKVGEDTTNTFWINTRGSEKETISPPNRSPSVILYCCFCIPKKARAPKSNLAKMPAVDLVNGINFAGRIRNVCICIYHHNCLRLSS